MKNKKQWIFVLLVVLTVGFIWSNSFFSQTESAEQSSRVLEIVRRFFVGIGAEHTNLFLFVEKYIRKIGHFSEYFLLGSETVFLFFWKDFRFGLQKFWNSLSLSVTVAVVDESIQIFSGRGPEVRDVLIDSSGALCGILLMFGLCRVISFLRQRKRSRVSS